MEPGSNVRADGQTSEARAEQVVQPASNERTSPEPEESSKTELSKEKEKSQDYLRRLQYLQADFENYRKRMEREMGEVKRYGNERLLMELLLINDEFELGLEKAQEDGSNQAVVEGFGMVLKRLQALLSKEGILRVEAVGKKFDPSLHEAALRVVSNKEEGTIIEEIRPGYTLKGRLLRPSIVKVAEANSGAFSDQNGQYKMENDTSKEETD